MVNGCTIRLVDVESVDHFSCNVPFAFGCCNPMGFVLHIPIPIPGALLSLISMDVHLKLGAGGLGGLMRDMNDRSL